MNNKYEQYIITFDLKTSKKDEIKLKKKYNKSFGLLYGAIKKHMKKNKFMWQQGSTYISKEKISFYTFQKIIDDLFLNNMWLTDFVRDMKNGIISDVNAINFDKIIEKYNKKLYKSNYVKNDFEEEKKKAKIKSEQTVFKDISNKNILKQ